MDAKVLAAQVYLNATYGGRNGFNTITEDGVTGWQTMYAITRALQIELGIASPANNFGNGTRTAYDSRIGSIGSGTSVQYVTLLQCALWCKGYWAGDLQSGWTSTVQDAVFSVRSNLGLTTTTLSVPSKLMKSLVTMDAYVIPFFSAGSTNIRTGQQWMNGAYWTRLNFDLVPTNGLFTREMQKGLLYGIQFELGMSDSVANGNFGPSTKSGLKTVGVVGPGSAGAFVRLYQTALACNGYELTISGTFDADTTAATTAFQQFMEIAVTGIGDFGTWAALLVSTGDPDRAVTGMDTRTPLTAATAAARYAEGYRIVGRYLTVTSKAITPGELQIIFAAGLSLLPIFQNYNNAASYFTKATGFDHGLQAAIRARELGLESCVIFFAVDYDATATEADSIVLDYFRGIADGLAASLAINYRVGVYGTRNVCTVVHNADLAAGVWVSGMSTGYSGNLGFKMPADWWYNQIQELTSPAIDRNVVSVRALPVAAAQVASTPVVNGEFDPLYWGVKTADEIFGLMKLQVLAEKCLHDVGSNVTRYADMIVMFWLQQENYASTDTDESWAWEAYTPTFETLAGVSGNYELSLAIAARIAFFALAGDIHQLDEFYPGQLDHAAATAHGVLNWGDHAGSRSVAMGDLGGWALDLVQLWAAYCDAGQPTLLAEWITQNFATVGGAGMGRADTIADADGWLVGDQMRNHGNTFGGSWRHTLHSNPSWQQRMNAFLNQRFGTQSVLFECIVDLFTTEVDYVGTARAQFIDGAPLPTPSQLPELASTLTTRFWALANE